MKNSVRDFKTKSHGLMVAFSILISGSFILGSFVANAIDPSAISALRFFLAFLILAFVIKLNNLGKGLLLKKMWRYIILGGLVSLYFVLMFEGLKTASPIAMSAIMTMTPFLASVLEYFIYKRRTDLIIFVALLIGAFGSVWIIFDADFKKIIYFNIGHGETLFLFGCAAQALYTILVKTLNEGESALEQTSNTMLVSAILLVIIDFKEIINTNLITESLRKEKLIRKQLQHPDVKEIRGKGLMLTAIVETPELAAKIIHQCLKNGLILFFLLFEGKAMRITPPLTISDEEITEGCAILLKSINEVLK